MADSKISAMGALSERPALNDLFVIVDVSDSTMDEAGTNKYVQSQYVCATDRLTVTSSADSTYVMPYGPVATLIASNAYYSSAGNSRGAGAIDLQVSRAIDSRVASGIFSVIAGGRDNLASGQDSSVTGGYLNQATGQQSTVIGGFRNTASNYTSIAGGSYCVASGIGSVAFGSNSQADEKYSTVIGRYGKSNNVGELVFSNYALEPSPGSVETGSTQRTECSYVGIINTGNAYLQSTGDGDYVHQTASDNTELLEISAIAVVNETLEVAVWKWMLIVQYSEGTLIGIVKARDAITGANITVSNSLSGNVLDETAGELKLSVGTFTNTIAFYAYSGDLNSRWHLVVRSLNVQHVPPSNASGSGSA